MPYGYAIFLTLVLTLVPSTPRAQTQEAAGPAGPIHLDSYQVVQLELKQPVELLDTEGRLERYSRAYLVTLKGSFPRDRGLGLQLYIGDYRIPEYGGTSDGLYFRIYDPKLLTRLEGKPFRYQFGTQPVRNFGLIFSLKQPIRVVKQPAK